MKNIKKLLLLVMIFSVTLLGVGCGNKNAKTTQMQVDLNPSVEFMLDKNNKVVSVTALNDDGAIIISGEAFVGLKADEAVELYVKVCTDTGYLVQGSATATKNNDLKISLSCDTAQAKEIYKKAKSKVEKFYNDNNIKGNLAELKEISIDDIKATVYASFPELEGQEISKDELLAKLKEARVETKDILSTNIRNMYYTAKDYELSLAENEKIAEIINNAGDAYAEIYKTYKDVITRFDDAIEKLNSVRNEYLIDDSSSYQKAVKEVLEAKKELLKLEKRYAELDAKEDRTLSESAEYLKLGTELNVKKTALTTLETGLNTAYTLANSTIDISINSLKAIKKELEAVEKRFPEEIKTTLKQKTADIDKTVNEEKAKFFAEFEKEYKEQIEEYNKFIESLKIEMKENNK